jgi:ATP-dependent DNA helicase RecG
MPSERPEQNVEISALRRALSVERRARFSDFQGKRSTFSQFMRQAADKLCKRFPIESRWATIRGLFRQYPNLDVATRISIVNRADDLIEQLAQLKQPLSTPAPADAEAVKTGKPACKVEPKAPTASAVQSSLSPKESELARSGDQRLAQTIDQIDVKFVRGVGPKLADLLAGLDIFTVEDLIRHYPRRHLDFQNRLRVRDLSAGQEVTVLGTIRSVGSFQARKGNVSVLSVTIHDGTGSISVTRFIGGKSNKYLLDRYKEQFPKGAQVLASGIVEQDRYSNRLRLKNAEIELLGALADDCQELETIHTGRLVPVYALTEGLSLRYLRSIIHSALESYADKIVDALPEEIQEKYSLVGLKSALQGIHFPDEPEQKDRARRRLVFDELFNIQLQLAWRRHHMDINETALALNTQDGGLVERFKQALPFKLTGAQERVFQEIVRDLASDKPMHRLVQGDVGSGKTVVAMMAFLVALENDYQGAMMAPTEILAEQHYRQFVRWLTPLGIKCALLLGKQGQRERRQIQQDLLSGQVHVAIGTHALIQDVVEFKNLGLIIIDEQHRFGVKQRAALKAKGQNPELLTMTATPIPRTLALTFHGDLDVSEIDEMPPGRKPIATKIVPPGKKRELWEFVDKEIGRGRQAYVVFPLIEESETLSAKAATAEFEKLKTGEFKHRRLGLMHGKLKPQEKDEVMERFRRGELEILISTTVIEVGVDVPNSTVMVVENADRFGLAQLHQLRGRVGRGAEQSYCFLVSDLKSEATRQRLEILTKTNDGFVVAEKDLELRGPGEFLGTRQSGLPDLFLTDLIADAEILEQARHAAVDLIKSDPDLVRYRQLRARVEVALDSLEADLLGSG